jgi:hypothetical protein
MYSKFGGMYSKFGGQICTVNIPELFDKSPNLKEKFM